MLTTSSGLRIPNWSFWTRHSRAEEKLNWDGMMRSCRYRVVCCLFRPCLTPFLAPTKRGPSWDFCFCTRCPLARLSLLLRRSAENLPLYPTRPSPELRGGARFSVPLRTPDRSLTAAGPAPLFFFLPLRAGCSSRAKLKIRPAEAAGTSRPPPEVYSRRGGTGSKQPSRTPLSLGRLIVEGGAAFFWGKKNI